MRGFYSKLSPISKLGVVVFMVLISLVVSLIVAAVLAVPIFGQQAFSSIIGSSLTFNEANLPLLKYFQVVQSIGMFIVPPVVLAFIFDGKIAGYLRLSNNPHKLSIILSVAVVLAASPIINLVGMWNMQLSLPDSMLGIEQWMREKEDSAKIVTELFVNVKTTKGLIFNVFMIGLLPAIGEELLFRGVIQRIFKDWTNNSHVAIWITAILFSALHLQFYGFLPRVILGAMFGYLLVWSGNLWLPMVAHFVNNTAAVIAYFLYNKELIHVDPDSIGTESGYGSIAAVVSLIVVVFIIGWLKRIEEQRLKL